MTRRRWISRWKQKLRWRCKFKVDFVMPLRPKSQRHRSFSREMIRSTNNVWLHRFACALSVATLFLVALGGVVTTKGVGMAVPDWPTTYGENMFLFPPSKW